MKKRINILYATMTVFEVLFFAGAYLVHYFTRTKMGMARYVLYKNRQWQEAYPIELLNIFSLAAVVVIAALVALWLFKRKRTKTIMTKLVMGEMAAVTIIYAGFVLFQSVEDMRAYFWVCGLLCLAALIQLLKTVVVTALQPRE